MESIRLDRRPEARALSVETLLQHVRDGKVRLPEFQRPLRWRSSHVLELFDSIYRGFPIGELLLSKREAPAARLHFGPYVVAAPAMSDGLFVVDGQQRITALAGAMLHPDKRPRGDIHAVWFNLERERFFRLQESEPPPPSIPVNVVGDSFQLLSWLNEWPFRTERIDLVQRAIALGKALREYQIPAYIVEGATEDALRLIFKRVNTSGVQMEETEVFNALYGASEPSPLTRACARLAETGFGNVGEDWFLRCLKAVEGRDPRQRFGDSGAKAPEPQAIERTEAALRRAIAFLTEDASIPHIQLLPYGLALIGLARFFHLHSQPHPRARELLKRWVWRGALSGTHSGSSDAAVRAIQQNIDGDEFASTRRLLQSLPTTAFSPPSAKTPWNGRSAKTRMCAIALFQLGARDPETGEPLQLQDIQALLDEKRESSKVFLDAGGARHTTMACHFLLGERRKLELLPDASPEVLKSHALDADAAEALRNKDLAALKTHRERVLDPWLERFFKERLALDDSDRPSILELVRQVDLVAASP